MPFRDPEPTHQPVLNHVSPRIRDFVFWETRSLNEWLNKCPDWEEFETVHPNRALYPNHILAAVAEAGEGNVRLAWAANRTEQEAYNYEVVENPGGNRWPQLRQVWVIRRSAYTRGMAVAGPPAGIGGVWTRIDDQERKLDDPALDAVFVRLDVTYEDHTLDLHGLELDSETGKVIPFTIEKVPAGTAGADTGATGLHSVIDPLNVYWSLKTTRKASALVDDSLTWETSEAFAWPPVLTQWEYWNIDNLSGISFFYKEYFGEVKCVNLLEWSQQPPVGFTPTAMNPTGINWQTPVVAVNMRSCLHDWLFVTATRAGVTIRHDSFATDPIDWPDVVIRRPSVRPHPRGGWLTHTKTFHKPGT